MAFELNKVVPWGRNFWEYSSFYNLDASDLNKQIVSFGDGPASFNSKMNRLGKKVISVDPIYQFSKEEIKQRIDQTCTTVMGQLRENQNDFVWRNIQNTEELERIRMEAMLVFLEDFELGKKQGRYVPHELPDKTKFADQSFDLGLSSHFLILYSQLGLDFHIASINEMLRVCKEIRIFPLLNLQSKPSEVLEDVIQYFSKDYKVDIKPVDYEFQKGGNQMLVINSSK